MVPDCFQAVLRNREWGRRAIKVGQAEAVELGIDRLALDPGSDVGRHGRGAVGRIHRHLEVRVLGEQRLHTRSHFVLVLRQVLCRDGEQRFFRSEGVDIALLRRPTGRRLRKATGISRNAAIGIAFHLTAKRRQVGAQAGGFFGSDLGCSRATEAQQYGAGKGGQEHAPGRYFHV
ncbi:hypothetical protein D3C76_578730 [compost metagenome]